MFGRKLKVCQVCGSIVDLKKLKLEEIYITRDDVETGFGAGFKASMEPALWHTFDCPVCGCQNRISRRYRKFTPRYRNPQGTDKVTEEGWEDE